MKKQKRNTKTKQMVMDVMQSESSSALSHSDIEQRLGGKIDRVTIYRILQGFCDDGIIHKIPDENGKTYYALCHDCSEGHHHDSHLHFRCVSCDTVSCVDAPAPISHLPAGYSMSGVSCLVSGYCPNCSPDVVE
ncbi:MAG: transcriptional repressor [Prevotellaceae bacterium]|jgi:Fe2+ or Zn2+ uptake regulation protein|nr:transcriptional repressor [Prevotellaceae bacterium]